MFLIVLVFAVSGLPQAARSAGTDFPVAPIVLALVLWAVIIILRAIGEFGTSAGPGR